jgi:hypothetical protein
LFNRGSIAVPLIATTSARLTAPISLASALCPSRSQLVVRLTLPMSKDELLERNERGARDEAPGEWSGNNEKRAWGEVLYPQNSTVRFGGR